MLVILCEFLCSYWTGEAGRGHAMSYVCKCTVTKAVSDRKGGARLRSTDAGHKVLNSSRLHPSNVIVFIIFFVCLRVENKGPYFPFVCGFSCKGRKPIKWFMKVMWWLSISGHGLLVHCGCGLNLILIVNKRYNTVSEKYQEHKIRVFKYKSSLHRISLSLFTLQKWVVLHSCNLHKHMHH